MIIRIPPKFFLLFCLFFGSIFLSNAVIFAEKSTPYAVKNQYSGDVLPTSLISLNSAKGAALLSIKYAHSYLGLMSYFTTERGLSY